MSNLALFDLDNTLLPLDSDYEWGCFIAKTGAIDTAEFERKNAAFFEQYKVGTLNPTEFLEFVLGTIAVFPRSQLDAWHRQFMKEVIEPAMLPPAKALLKKHQDAGDLMAIVTATNRFITGPIARAFGVKNLIAATPEERADGNLTGRLLGTHTSGENKIKHTENWLASLGKTWKSFEKCYFYSDSFNDLPLLNKVTNPVAANPDDRLKTYALAHNWTVLNLFHV